MAIPANFEGSHWGLFDSFTHLYILHRSPANPNEYNGEIVLVHHGTAEAGRRSPIKATVVNGATLVMTRFLGGQQLTATFDNFQILNLGGTNYAVGKFSDNFSIAVKT